MSKKDFVALADYIREYEERFNADAIAGMADFLSRTYPRFNRERWLDYIRGHVGPNGGKRGG